MSEPMWMGGDPAALGMDDCDECGYDHDIDGECIEEDPDRMWDEMNEE
jgi:hypothetical protein